MRRLLAALVLSSVLATGCERLVVVETAPLELRPVATPTQSLVYAADGSVIATLRRQHRVLVERDDLPPVLVKAVLATEDRRFYRHAGVDLRAIARAAVANQRAGRVVQGGSTITQQLVKNRYFPDAPDTLERKSAEARLALALERESTKDEILTDYLNTVYLGEGAYGVEAAARHYFGVGTRRLRLRQAALLAGLIRTPEASAPHDHPKAARRARARVLQAMAETGAIGGRRARAARRAPLGVRPRPAPPRTRFPHFVEYVKRSLLEDPALGPTRASRERRLYGGGLRIHTTIQPRLQVAAEEAARRFLPSLHDPEVAVAAVRPADGAVVALVGGRDFRRQQYDLATQGHRQPGSTFKTFALVAALRAGWRPDDVIDSGPGVLTVPTTGEPWSVDSGTSGSLSLERALALSSNGAFARLALELGGGRIADQAEAMGVTSRVGTNPAIVLGGVREGVTPLEMASAYGSLANAGAHVATSGVTKVTDARGRLLVRGRRQATVAADPEVAYLTTRALQQVVTAGTGRAAAIGRPVAGKTGTSQGYRDAWFVGYTPQLAAAVWVGYPRRERPMVGVAGLARVEGGTLPARIWAAFMSQALRGRPVADFLYPRAARVTVRVDPDSGLLAAPWCGPGVVRRGLPMELPTETCPVPPPQPIATPAPVGTPQETPSPSPPAALVPADGQTEEPPPAEPPSEAASEPTPEEQPEPRRRREPERDGTGSAGDPSEDATTG